MWATQIQRGPLKSNKGHSNPPMGHSNPCCMKLDNAGPEEGQSLVGHQKSNRRFWQKFQQEILTDVPTTPTTCHSISRSLHKETEPVEPGKFPEEMPNLGETPKKRQKFTHSETTRWDQRAAYGHHPHQTEVINPVFFNQMARYSTKRLGIQPDGSVFNQTASQLHHGCPLGCPVGDFLLTDGLTILAWIEIDCHLGAINHPATLHTQ